MRNCAVCPGLLAGIASMILDLGLHCIASMIMSLGLRPVMDI